MKKTNPNVKLFIFITDPVGRAYSQITQILRPEMKRLRHRFREYENAHEVIKAATDYIKAIKVRSLFYEQYMKYKNI